MNALTRQAIVILVLVPMAVCVLGLRFACDSTDLRRIMREAHRYEEQRHLRQAISRRTESRQEVVRKLIVQEFSLKEALARFQELDHEWPDYVRELSMADWRNCSDEERNYQYILRIAKDLLEKRPEEATEVLQRLERDYQQLRASQPMPSAMWKKQSEPSR